EGEILVLMGLSGSGKSTLLRTINGLSAVSSGRVHLKTQDGWREVTAAGRRELREIRTRLVSMVFQHFSLLPWRSVADNVALGLELAGVPAAERRRRVTEQLALVGLADRA